MKTSKLAQMRESDFDFRGPNGEILHLEDVASIRAIHLNKLEDKDNTYFVDLVDVKGNSRKNYTCSFSCLNFTITMLFAEGDAEDKTIVNMSFESLVTLLTTSRNTGYEDAAENSFGNEFSEDADEEYIKREPTAILH